MQAAYHDNAYLVKHLVEVVGVNPNDESQRTAVVKGEEVGLNSNYGLGFRASNS